MLDLAFSVESTSKLPAHSPPTLAFLTIEAPAENHLALSILNRPYLADGVLLYALLRMWKRTTWVACRSLPLLYLGYDKSQDVSGGRGVGWLADGPLLHVHVSNSV